MTLEEFATTHTDEAGFVAWALAFVVCVASGVLLYRLARRDGLSQHRRATIGAVAAILIAVALARLVPLCLDSINIEPLGAAPGGS